MPNIKLQSSDEVIFDVEVKIAKVSGTVKTMLEDCGMENDENTIIPLLNVHSNILRKILEWAEHHKEDPEPTKENKQQRTENISPWDTEFLDVDQSTLFELITAANYLDIMALMDLTCKTVANMIKGKTPAEICDTFQIERPPALEEASKE